MTRVIAINGIHGSGKSTVGRRLAELTNATFYPEIGGELRKQITDSTMQSGEHFDRLVMEMEFDRDLRILSGNGVSIIETWHYGNLAYARIRSPRVYSEYVSRLKQHLRQFTASAILLEIEPQVFLRRMTEKVKPVDIPAYIEFFERIKQNTHDAYREFGVEYRCIDSSRTLRETIAAVLATV